MSGWHLDIFECLAGVDQPHPTVCKIGGWVKDPFAIDRRWVFDPEGDGAASGWMVTHLPTGFCCFGVVGQKELAFQIVDELASGGDWDFVDVSGGKRNSEIVSALRKRHPEIKGPSRFEAALWLDGGFS